MNTLSGLPAEIRFYHDLLQERDIHIAASEQTLGVIATQRTAWLELEHTWSAINFRSASQAEPRLLYPDEGGLIFLLRLVDAEGEPYSLPQDEANVDEILKAMTAEGSLYEDMTHEEAKEIEFTPGQYVVIASPEGPPCIVNFYIYDTFGAEAANSQNASRLTGQDCASLLGFLKIAKPDLRSFDLEFVCEQPV